ncbi:hypothetical protein [Luteolibacter sp. LG18]|uniref:hypothetical protein n=1 Tax=Luteolibacter sp. LG18 TaxID=2819286 RepID=UPI002B322637|nr:hypothetical protein llg_24790 [Luteolibacter sp. LG18]
MQTPSDSSDFHAPHPPSIWRKLGGGSLSVSLIVHAVLLGVGVAWVFQVIPATPTPEFSTGGGPSGPQGVRSQMEQRKSARKVDLNSRIVMQGFGEIVLPKMEPGEAMTNIGGMGNSLEPGIGKLGPGGNGPGGPGNGPVGAPGLNKIEIPMWGSPDPNANSLVGTFYDTKLDSHGKDTGMTADKLREVIQDFTTRGWNERTLESKYYKAPKTLYQTKLYIPEMSADAAPSAFGCGPEIKASRWIVLYRGQVSAPQSGKFRFVGAGDDVLVVRFNNQNVFDHGFTQGTTGLYVPGKVDFLAGRREDKDLARQVRGGVTKTPVTFYQYETTRNWNQNIGGLAVGPEFEVSAGRSYPIEILVSEVPGGLFGASLLIEKAGTDYPKAAGGAPVLPLFRLDSSVPAATRADNAPPYDPAGPVWKVTGQSVRPGI